MRPNTSRRTAHINSDDEAVPVDARVPEVVGVADDEKAAVAVVEPVPVTAMVVVEPATDVVVAACVVVVAPVVDVAARVVDVAARMVVVAAAVVVVAADVVVADTASTRS